MTMRPPRIHPAPAWWLGPLVLAAGAALPFSQEDLEPDPGATVRPMQIQYLEIVTPAVDATCAALAQLHGVEFSEPDEGLGGARTAALEGGGRIGVRAPLRDDEEPVVRPYLLVEDIGAAVESAEAAGGVIAHPPLELPGHGTFAIYFQGGIQHGLWQL